MLYYSSLCYIFYHFSFDLSHLFLYLTYFIWRSIQWQCSWWKTPHRVGWSFCKRCAVHQTCFEKKKTNFPCRKIEGKKAERIEGLIFFSDFYRKFRILVRHHFRSLRYLLSRTPTVYFCNHLSVRRKHLTIWMSMYCFWNHTVSR